MAIFTSAQLRSRGGSVSRKARFKKKLGFNESTYSLILSALDEFHYKATTNNEYKSVDAKIAEAGAIGDLALDWLSHHHETNRSTKKRREALNMLVDQIAVMDWRVWTLNNIDHHLAKENFSTVLESGVVLRANGPLEKRITEFCKLTASNYAKEIVRPVVLRAAQTPNITTRSLADTKTATANKKIIKSLYDSLVDRILKAGVPTQFARGAKHVTDKILTRTNIPAAGYNTLVNFVFLRLLNPFLVTPVNLCVVDELPNGKLTAPSLVVIGKILQNQANRKPTFADQNLAGLTDLLTPYQKSIPKYLVKNVYRVAGGGGRTVMNQFYS